ncbi:MAG: RagB/SusD family nutrient uptake outer membrane protein, partial [Bacteroidales bacterium]|nr:RagB/SusD family nutrient uptake outer membrane protein [Bacteroidales bacterium]
MKTIYKKMVKYPGVLLLGLLLNTSCVDYLDKSPEVNITDEDVFGTFPKFQGFMEDIYQCVVDPTLSTTAECNWNYAGDELVSTNQQFLSAQFEKGNYRGWETLKYSAFLGTNTSPTNTQGRKGYWLNGWYGIRKANQAIANIGRLVNATQEERNIILGQAYFFRAYLHFEILRNWGHIAYIDTVYGATDLIKPQMQTYKYVADRIDADLRKAVELLPVDWEQTAVGQVTSGKNSIRVTKGAAYAYIGLNALYAGSPLSNGEETGSFTYNVALCEKAAAAYLEVIKLADDGVYKLETWANYKNNFYTLTAAVPLGKEVVWSYPTTMYKRYNYGDFSLSPLVGFGHYSAPTENYVQNFGMANGLP